MSETLEAGLTQHGTGTYADVTERGGRETKMDHNEQQDATSVYCSTSGTYFTDKDELAEHYRSDFHR